MRQKGKFSAPGHFFHLNAFTSAERVADQHSCSFGRHSLMTYPDIANPELLHLVSPQARRICEFGCAGGAFARAVKARQPEVYYVGIELMLEPLERARQVMDVGLLRNLDHTGNWDDDPEMVAALPKDSFDHIIFGDVLEHLHDPSAVLRQALNLLAPGGSLLACIPNAQHWSVFANLVHGSWPRHDQGLFDRTHIRWFTLNDMVQLITTSGLTIETIIPRIFEDQEKGVEIMEYLEPLAFFLGADPSELVRRGLPLQYVFKAIRTS